MARFTYDAHTLGLKDVLEGFGDLLCHALLHLQASTEHVNDTRNFAESNHLVSWQIRNVRFAVERQQVVLAEAEEFDVLDNYHFIVVNVEERAVDNGLHI